MRSSRVLSWMSMTGAANTDATSVANAISIIRIAESSAVEQIGKFRERKLELNDRLRFQNLGR
jgi:hypothetical protein